MTSPTTRYSHKETTALIRKALREAFPGTTFRVTTSRGSSYTNVTYTDGPDKADVQRVGDRFVHERFDGMDDSHHMIPGRDAYHCSGVLVSRSFSDAAKAWGVEQVKAHPGRYEYDGDWGEPTSPDSAAVRRVLANTDLAEALA